MISLWKEWQCSNCQYDSKTQNFDKTIDMSFIDKTLLFLLNVQEVCFFVLHWYKCICEKCIYDSACITFTLAMVGEPNVPEWGSTAGSWWFLLNRSLLFLTKKAFYWLKRNKMASSGKEKVSVTFKKCSVIICQVWF